MTHGDNTNWWGGGIYRVAMIMMESLMLKGCNQYLNNWGQCCWCPVAALTMICFNRACASGGLGCERAHCCFQGVPVHLLVLLPTQPRSIQEHHWWQASASCKCIFEPSNKEGSLSSRNVGELVSFYIISVWLLSNVCWRSNRDSQGPV